jgi:hypothetical protein
MAIIYELNNGRKSGSLPIIIPFNILHLISPFNSISNFEFKGLWDKIVTNSSPYPKSLSFNKPFTLDFIKC